MEVNTREALLDIACELVQARGFNAFSFRDLAARAGIKSASVHYHFPTKGDLGRALVEHYQNKVASALADPPGVASTGAQRLQRLFHLFQQTLAPQRRVCLCAPLLGEWSTLPPDVQAATRAYLEVMQEWVKKALIDGKQDGSVRVDGPPEAIARSMIAALQGALLAGAALGDAHWLSDAVTHWQSALVPE